ncbi:uncharacterized protein MONBRDRAFT_515, partial [Monosiga brevicollis MX1]
YGFIGPNGSGKSTLLRAIGEHRIQNLPPDLRTLFIDQEATFVNCPLVDFVVQGDADLVRIRRQIQNVQDGLEQASGDKLSQLMDELELMDGVGQAPEDRARAVLRDYGFSTAMLSTNLHELSGGWRMRAALARATFNPPEILLLDEPTNHLDLEGIEELEQRLEQLTCCVLVVSHDKMFLDHVCTDIVHLKDRSLHYFHGNLTAYQNHCEETFRKQLRQYELQEQRREHYQKTIDHAVQHARRTGDDKALGLAASRKKKLTERLGPDKREDGKKTPNVAAQGSAHVVLDTVAFAYAQDAPLILNNVSLRVDVGDHVGLVGRNGSGKSTLLKLIRKELAPTRGLVEIDRHASMGVFEQQHVDALDLTQTPLGYLAECFPDEKEQELRNHLGAFGLAKRSQLPLHLCSGGQRSRLVLAKLFLEAPALLILDEPTNHLDFDAIDALAEVLAAYAGTVIVASHDRAFLQTVASSIFRLSKGTLSR